MAIVVLFLSSACVVCFSILYFTFIKTYLLRYYYESQGIPFIKDCYPVIGAEIQVTELRKRNKSHDWLYIDRPIDFVGTIRGCSVQLYATSAEMAEKVVQQTGKHIDRNTPALYSFGQLSPFAITFAQISGPHFAERKACLTRALNDMERLYDIGSEQTANVLQKFAIGDDGQTVIDVRALLNIWTRETSGEFIWGKSNIKCSVQVLDSDGNMTELPFMTALNLTFTDLRFHSTTFWNRIYFPLAAWPITREARRLAYNVKVLRAEMARMMLTPEKGTVAERVQRENDAAGIPRDMTRDDLVTATIAGLDTVKSTIMGTLWHILQEENQSWREGILDELSGIGSDESKKVFSLAHCEKLNAMIHETLRYEPPGSLINNEATEDFSMSSGDRKYNIKSGTRIVPCIHALHQNEVSWKTGSQANAMPLTDFDPSRFLIYSNDIVGSKYFMPFGKGPRRCPGQGAGVLMVKSFVAAFLDKYPGCTIVLPDKQSRAITCFNILSRATFGLRCTAATKPQK